MPIDYVELPDFEPHLRRTPERMERQREYVETELETALSARVDQEQDWTEAMRQYKAQPEREMSFRPVRMRNIEVPLAAWACEQAYSQHDLLAVNTYPPVTVQSAPNGQFVDHARYFQEWVNWVGRNELKADDVSRTVFLDNCQLGTGIYYVPWETVIKRTADRKVVFTGPVARRIRPKNFLVPEGDWMGLEPPHGPPWVAIRWYLNEGQMRTKARYEEWDYDSSSPTVNTTDAEIRSPAKGVDNLYEVWQFWVDSHVWYEDGDAPADLLVTYDRTSHRILHIAWSPYDTRPFAIMRYQRQTDSFWGMGVPKMLQGLQAEASDFHQDRSRNRKLVNQRVYTAPAGSITGDQTMGVGDVILTSGIGGLVPLQQIPVFPSEQAEEGLLFAMAQQRTGITNQPGPEAGQRTPATTESIKSNQRNARAAPAVNDMSQGFAELHVQAMRRYNEKLRLETLRFENELALRDPTDPRPLPPRPIAEHILAVMGPRKGPLVLEVLSHPNFSREVSIETTATSATLNRETELQKLMQAFPLAQQQITQSVQAVQAMGQMTDEVSRAALRHGIEVGAEIMKRIFGQLDLRNGDDLVFDPRTARGAGGPGGGTLRDDLEQPAPAIPPGLVDQALQAEAQQPTGIFGELGADEGFAG